jgi:hypothetical protein
MSENLSSNQSVGSHQCDETGALLRQNRSSVRQTGWTNATKRVPRERCDKTGAFGRRCDKTGADRILPTVRHRFPARRPCFQPLDLRAKLRAGPLWREHCDKGGAIRDATRIGCVSQYTPTSLTLDQRTNIDGVPKAAELIEISGGHALEASDRAIMNMLYQHAHDSGVTRRFVQNCTLTGVGWSLRSLAAASGRAGNRTRLLIRPQAPPATRNTQFGTALISLAFRLSVRFWTNRPVTPL